MKPRDELTEEETRRMALAGSIIVVILFAICLPSFYFLVIADSPINVSNWVKAGASGFAALRMILPIVYLLWFLPGSILVEIADSWVKRRSFRSRNVLIFLLLFGELLLITGFLYTVFDMSLPGVSFLIQFPLIAVGFSVGLVLTVLTMEKTRIKSCLKKAFD